MTGEAADTPEFLNAVRDVATDYQEGGAELIILGDPTYGPAKGAAFWLWTKMSPTYCKEINAEQGIVDQYDMTKQTHLEL